MSSPSVNSVQSEISNTTQRILTKLQSLDAMAQDPIKFNDTDVEEVRSKLDTLQSDEKEEILVQLQKWVSGRANSYNKYDSQLLSNIESFQNFFQDSLSDELIALTSKMNNWDENLQKILMRINMFHMKLEDMWAKLPKEENEMASKEEQSGTLKVTKSAKFETLQLGEHDPTINEQIKHYMDQQEHLMKIINDMQNFLKNTKLELNKSREMEAIAKQRLKEISQQCSDLERINNEKENVLSQYREQERIHLRNMENRKIFNFQHFEEAPRPPYYLQFTLNRPKCLFKEAPVEPPPIVRVLDFFHEDIPPIEKYYEFVDAEPLYVDNTGPPPDLYFDDFDIFEVAPPPPPPYKIYNYCNVSVEPKEKKNAEINTESPHQFTKSQLNLLSFSPEDDFLDPTIKKLRKAQAVQTLPIIEKQPNPMETSMHIHEPIEFKKREFRAPDPLSNPNQNAQNTGNSYNKNINDSNSNSSRSSPYSDSPLTPVDQLSTPRSIDHRVIPPQAPRCAQTARTPRKSNHSSGIPGKDFPAKLSQNVNEEQCEYVENIQGYQTKKIDPKELENKIQIKECRSFVGESQSLVLQPQQEPRRQYHEYPQDVPRHKAVERLDAGIIDFLISRYVSKGDIRLTTHKGPIKKQFNTKSRQYAANFLAKARIHKVYEQKSNNARYHKLRSKTTRGDSYCFNLSPQTSPLNSRPLMIIRSISNRNQVITGEMPPVY